MSVPAQDQRNWHELSIAEAGARMRAGTFTARQLTDHALQRIETINPQINAFVTVTADRARADAKVADEAFAAGRDLGPLQGIPYGLKDIYDTAGIRTACHSKLRVDHVPQTDSAVAEALRRQGAVLVGKCTTNEFALGNPDPDAPFPPARNPWNIDHTPGGSSSGSGAAVAAGLVRIAMGSDTGASIRGPASFCGVVGLKPTFGLISRRGVFPLSPALDHCGPLTRSIEDAAVVLGAIAGFDSADPGSVRAAVPDLRALLRSGVNGLKIGVPRHFFSDTPGSEEATAALDASLEKLREAGATVEDITLPSYAKFSACGRVIMFTEAFAVHEKDFRERPRDFGFSTYMRMIMGAFTTGADLTQAFRQRRALTQAVNETLSRYDAIICATALLPAPPMQFPGDYALPSSSPVQCIQFNVTGHPALAVPTRFSQSRLPLALQIVTKHFDERLALRIGATLEQGNEVLSEWPDLAQV